MFYYLRQQNFTRVRKINDHLENIQLYFFDIYCIFLTFEHVAEISNVIPSLEKVIAFNAKGNLHLLFIKNLES